MGLSVKAAALLSALRRASEGGDILPSDDDVVWRDVYLDNANSPSLGIASRSLPGYLSALKKAGLYVPVDYAFGRVRMEDRS